MYQSYQYFAKIIEMQNHFPLFWEIAKVEILPLKLILKQPESSNYSKIYESFKTKFI